MPDNTYTTDIAIKQGAGSFLFFGNEVPAANAQAILYNQIRTQIIANSAGVLSTLSIPTDVGFVIFSLATAASNASAYLGSCIAGEEKTLFFRTTGAAASVFFSTDTGITVYGWLGQISSINAHGSAASNPIIKLRAIADDTWAVVDTTGQVTLNAIA